MRTVQQDMALCFALAYCVVALLALFWTGMDIARSVKRIFRALWERR